MQTKIVLASLVAAAAAYDFSALERRQFSKECEAESQELQAAGPPQVPQDVLQDVLQATDPCNYTPTGSISSKLASYNSAKSSWAADHKSLVSKVSKACGGDLDAAVDACSSGGLGAEPTGASSPASGDATTTAGAGKATETGSGSGSGDAKSTSKPNGVAGSPVAAGGLMVAGLAAALL